MATNVPEPGPRQNRRGCAESKQKAEWPGCRGGGRLQRDWTVKIVPTSCQSFAITVDHGQPTLTLVLIMP